MTSYQEYAARQTVAVGETAELHHLQTGVSLKNQHPGTDRPAVLRVRRADIFSERRLLVRQP